MDQQLFNILAMIGIVTLLWSFFGVLVYAMLIVPYTVVMRGIQVLLCGPVIWAMVITETIEVLRNKRKS